LTLEHYYFINGDDRFWRHAAIASISMYGVGGRSPFKKSTEQYQAIHRMPWLLNFGVN